MKKLLRLFVLLAVLSSTSCVDNDYDLSKIDTDDLTIGGEGSEFRIPLATIKFTMEDIASNGVDIAEIFNEADTWLPTSLPDTDTEGSYADISKLNDANAAYLTTLLNNLTSEIKTNDAKCDAVAKCIYKNPTYKKAFEAHLPAGLNTEIAFVQAFRTAFRTNTTIQNEAKKLAANYLALNLHVSLQTFTIEHINIDGEIVDMLSKNLDKPGNSLHIYGQITSLLPVSMTITRPTFSGTDLDFGNIAVKASATSDIRPANVTEKDLRQIVERVEITLPVTLDKYYPAKGFKASEKDQVTLNLRLVKKGGLDLNL